MKTLAGRHGAFVKMFSSAVVNQALLSGTSLVVSLILIRNTSDREYGYYVLVLAAMLLLSSLQNSFYQPAMVERMTRYDQPQRQALIGGLITEIRRAWLWLAGAVLALAAGLGITGLLPVELAALLAISTVAALATVRREFGRTTLIAHHRIDAVFTADLAYALLMVAGVGVAVLFPQSSLAAVATLALASAIGGSLLMRRLKAHEAWDTPGERGILRQIAPLAIWSTAGAVIHWSFSQGYTYLVAGTLDVVAVAAIGATRLTLMPVNLLSTGIGSLMLPLAARWLHHHGARHAFNRLILFAGGLAGAALLYFAVLWLLRDWIFGSLLKKQFADRDLLLLLWGAASVLAVVRDQLVFLPVARQRFHPLTGLAAGSAITALVTSYVGILHLGVAGALIGVLVGEAINLAGLFVLSAREIRQEEASKKSDSPPPAA
ncbi:hypothetical protein [Nevskia sp.]|uniref:lipopolysaccharide biosynthesis protein n=1 Tax=Nevskia sp. TaxID=1929292 RepID=UPI0025DD10D4|nr:hypothetical protein [Nevskia sp.]